MNGWLTDGTSTIPMPRLLDWLTSWLIAWLMVLINWLTNFLTYCSTDWISDLFIKWPTDWMIKWLTAVLLHWLTDRLTWLTDWMKWTDWLIVSWATDWLANWLADGHNFLHFLLFHISPLHVFYFPPFASLPPLFLFSECHLILLPFPVFSSSYFPLLFPLTSLLFFFSPLTFSFLPLLSSQCTSSLPFASPVSFFPPNENTCSTWQTNRPSYRPTTIRPTDEQPSKQPTKPFLATDQQPSDQRDQIFIHLYFGRSSVWRLSLITACCVPFSCLPTRGTHTHTKKQQQHN